MQIYGNLWRQELILGLIRSVKEKALVNTCYRAVSLEWENV